MSLEFSLNQHAPASAAVDCIVVGAFADGALTPAANAVDAASGGKLRALVERGDVIGKTGKTALLHDLAGVAAPRVLVIGLGEAGKFGVPQYIKAVGDAARTLKTGAGDVRAVHPRRSRGHRPRHGLEHPHRDHRRRPRLLPLHRDPGREEQEARREGPHALRDRRRRQCGACARHRHRGRRAVHPRARQPAAEHLQPGLPRRSRHRNSPRAATRSSARCWTMPGWTRSAWARCWRWRAALPTARGWSC